MAGKIVGDLVVKLRVEPDLDSARIAGQKLRDAAGPAGAVGASAAGGSVHAPRADGGGDDGVISAATGRLAAAKARFEKGILDSILIMERMADMVGGQAGGGMRAQAMRMRAAQNDQFRDLYHSTVRQLGAADERRFYADISGRGPNSRLQSLRERMAQTDPDSDEFVRLQGRAGQLSGPRGHTGLNSQVLSTGNWMNFLFGGSELAQASIASSESRRFMVQHPGDMPGQLKANDAAMKAITSGMIGSQIGMVGEVMANAIESAQNDSGVVAKVNRAALSVLRYTPDLGGVAARYGDRMLDTRNRIEEAQNIIGSDETIDRLKTGRLQTQADTRVGRVALAALDPADAQRASADEELGFAKQQAIKDRRTASGRNVSAGQRALEMREIADAEAAANDSRNVKVANIDRAVRERIRDNVFAAESSGAIGMMKAQGLDFGASRRGVIDQGIADYRGAKSFEEGAAVLKRVGEQLQALTSGNARETQMSIGKMAGQTLASTLSRSGDSLGASLASINGQFLPQFTGNKLTGFQGLDKSNPLYQQQFTAQAQAYNEAKNAAFQNEARREILQKGNISVLDAELARDRLGASEARLSAQRDADLNGVPKDSKRAKEVWAEYFRASELNERTFNEDRDLTRSSLQGDIEQAELLAGPERTNRFDRRRGAPIAAGAKGAFDSAIEASERFRFAGDDVSQHRSLELGEQNLIGIKNQLLNAPLFGSTVSTSTPFGVDFSGKSDKAPHEDFKASLQFVEQLLTDIRERL